MNKHIKHMLDRRPELAASVEDIAQAYGLMRDCYRSGGKLLLCGNGGSAADAEHWAGELMKGFESVRPLDDSSKAGLPEPLARALQGALPAVPLTGFPSLATAFANDVKPEYVFAQMVWGLGKKGDVLVGLSTSGNSLNVCHAVETARARGLATVALTGEGGGRLAELADVTIKAPASRTCEVQEYHLPVYHCICLMLEDEFFKS